MTIRDLAVHPLVNRLPGALSGDEPKWEQANQILTPEGSEGLTEQFSAKGDIADHCVS